MGSNVLVAVPVYDGKVHGATAASIYSNAMANGVKSIKFVKGYGAAEARNEIAKATLEGGYSHVMMVDSDMHLPDGALKMLMESNSDICLGVYPRRSSGSESGFDDYSCVFKLDGLRDFETPYTRHELKYLAEVSQVIAQEVKGGGLGCALISRNVFARIDRPYFDFVHYANGKKLSEDLYFCNKARNAGFKVYADPRVNCGHLRTGYETCY